MDHLLFTRDLQEGKSYTTIDNRVLKRDRKRNNVTSQIRTFLLEFRVLRHEHTRYTICLQTVIYVSGSGFVYTAYTLMNGRGYHMSTDYNLRKWAWLTKEAELRYDV